MLNNAKTFSSFVSVQNNSNEYKTSNHSLFPNEWTSDGVVEPLSTIKSN
jgi:hypothetical protein